MEETAPSEVQVRAAFLRYLQIVNGSTRHFTVGRCAASDFQNLPARSMYDGACPPICLFCGSAGEAAWLEKRLIEYSRQHFSGRCLNYQLGGGPQSGEAQHFVYMIEWPLAQALGLMVEQMIKGQG